MPLRFFFLRDRHLISLSKLSSRGRKNTERIAGRNLYRPATREREKLSLDESPVKSSRESMTRCVSATSRLRSHNRIGTSMASLGLGHISPISHSFRLMWSPPLPPSFTNLFTKLACKCARKTCLLDKWHLADIKINEANARGKIMWNDPEERAKVQVESFKMSSLARRCRRSARDPRSRNRNWPFGNAGNFLGGWWAREYCWIYVPACSNVVLSFLRHKSSWFNTRITEGWCLLQQSYSTVSHYPNLPASSRFDALYNLCSINLRLVLRIGYKTGYIDK